MVAGAILIGVVTWLAATAIAQDDVSPGGKPSRTITVIDRHGEGRAGRGGR
jgi:hypothetical protein